MLIPLSWPLPRITTTMVVALPTECDATEHQEMCYLLKKITILLYIFNTKTKKSWRFSIKIAIMLGALLIIIIIHLCAAIKVLRVNLVFSLLTIITLSCSKPIKMKNKMIIDNINDLLYYLINRYSYLFRCIFCFSLNINYQNFTWLWIILFVLLRIMFDGKIFQNRRFE